MSNNRSTTFNMNHPGGQKLIRVVNNVDVLASIKEGTYLTGSQGVGVPAECSNENAWSSIFVWGVLANATIKFRIGPRNDVMFDYPSPHNHSDQNCYISTGITAAGVYYFDKVLGNNYGQISWSGAGATADFYVAVTQQVV
jgi:hypothetical protein